MTRLSALVPLASLGAVSVYFRPEILPPRHFADNPAFSALAGLAWVVVGALAGVLTTSAFFVAFHLLYSPLYLIRLIPRLFSSGGWGDAREVRFYGRCFVLLLLLGGLAAAKPTTALVAFLLLTGSTPVLFLSQSGPVPPGPPRRHGLAAGIVVERRRHPQRRISARVHQWLGDGVSAIGRAVDGGVGGHSLTTLDRARVALPELTPVRSPELAEGSKHQSAARRKLIQIIGRIHAATRLDTIFVDLKQDILDLFDATEMTIYAADRRRREIYSRFLEVDTIEEIRLPISPTSVAGYVAASGKRVNIADAYDPAELARVDADLRFDGSWDRRTGFRTRQILAVPVRHEYVGLMGVLQLLNRKHGDRFTTEDEKRATEIAKALATAFSVLRRWSERRPGRFDYLLRQGLLTPDQLDAAIAEARRQQTEVESILLDTYHIPKEDIGVALSMFYQCRFVEFSDEIVIPPDLLAAVKVEHLKFNVWVPLARRGKVVDVLIDNPHDLPKVDNVERVFPGADVRFFVGLRQDILQLIDAATGKNGAPRTFPPTPAAPVDTPPAQEEEPGVDDVDLGDSAVVRLAHQLIVDAHAAGASDIHIEPRGPKGDTVIRFRVDGQCIQYERVPSSLRHALVARLKIMAQLDIAERRKPQDGKMICRVGERRAELRVVTVPTAGGNEDVVMRILASSAPVPLAGVGMTERNLREFQRIASRPYGLILCVGPTGSGKTTTLHAVLGFLNTPGRKIWTAEDPVEITQDGLRQVQVRPRIDFTFAAALRAFLRADPDVIMVGEMRDLETAGTAVNAALTGHLVLSTLHTNSAAATVLRLLNMGVDCFTFADAVLGILAQRLVRRLCPDCKEAFEPTAADYEQLANAYGREDFEKLGVASGDGSRLYRGRGCATCNRTGYKGRAAIHELLIASEAIKQLIETRGRVPDILDQAKAEGMTTLVQDGILKSLQGLTTPEQVLSVAME